MITRPIGYGWGTQLNTSFAGRAEVAPPAVVTISSFGVSDAFSADHRPLKSKPGKAEQEFNRKVARMAQKSGLQMLREKREADRIARLMQQSISMSRQVAEQNAELRKRQKELERQLKELAKA